MEIPNDSSSAVTVNLSISGVSAGKEVTLAFTNGQEFSATSLPDAGMDASANAGMNFPGARSKIIASRPQYVLQHEDAHRRILDLNKQSTNQLKTARHARIGATIKQPKIMPTPAVGATRAWLESGFTNKPYPTTNQYVCALPSGRNVVFWKSDSDTQLTGSVLSSFTAAVCGAGQGFDKLVGLIGDVWGSHTYGNDLIEDTALAKQDINIVFLDAPAGAGWAGYFFGANNFLSTVNSSSNEALVFFVNTNGIADDVNFYISTLIHEAKHMIGFYQEAVVREKSVDTWYEETSAMMAEDMVSYAVTGFNKIAQYRIPYYLFLGGSVSLNDWPSLSGPNYGMGGAFGAFLNRRYGTDLFVNSIAGCTSGAAKNSSYACLDQLIAALGGVGVADELARMGASLFSASPGSALPTGYGYPSITSNGYTLSAIDVSSMTLGAPNTMTSYTSMTQTYLRQTLGIGTTQYKRNNVVVPAHTTLYLVVR